jgi:hypothetical protein
MNRLFNATYDAKERVFRVDDAPEGVVDGATVTLLALESPKDDDPARPWIKFRGCLSEENGAELAALIEEMFPTEK